MISSTSTTTATTRVPLWEREEFTVWARHIAEVLSRAGSVLNGTNTMATDFDGRFEKSAMPMFLVNGDACLSRVNRSFAKTLGYQAADLVGRSMASLIDNAEAASANDLIRFVRRDGEFVWAWSSICSLVNDPHSSLVQLVDVTAEINLLLASLHEREQLAVADPLTGAANRDTTQRYLNDLMDAKRLEVAAGDQSTGVAVIALDVDRFTALNDLYGQAFGDYCLVRLTDIVNTVLEGKHLVGRLGGDEFMVVLDGITSARQAQKMAALIDDAIGTFVVDASGSGKVAVTTSSGLAWTSDPVDPMGMLASAFERLEASKPDSDSEVWLPDGVDEDGAAVGTTIRRQLLAELRTAIELEQFVLHYQPVVDAEGSVAAVEALIRWNHPERGLLAPDAFVPLLLETGLMADVGVWVVDAGLAQIAEWHRDFGVRIKLNVNASAGEIGRPEYLEAIVSGLERHGVPAEDLAVELTEQMVSKMTVTPGALNAIAAAGVNIVLDDFGTGISSLSHLRNVALRGVKIDRSFVSETAPGDIDRRIVRGMIQMANSLGVQVTAEGIETEEQAEWIRSLGCDLLQGYYFGRPSAAADVAALIRIDCPQPV